MSNLNTTTDQSQYILNKCIDTDFFALDVIMFGEASTGAGTARRVTTTALAGDKVALDVSLASVPSHAVTNAGTFATQATLQTGANLVGDVAIQPRTSGGWTPSSKTALSNTKTAVKATPGLFGGYIIHNPAAATTYIQVWDVAIGSITVGTTAATYVIGIPAGSTANVEFTAGIGHSVEINVAATTTATGSTAPATAAVCTFLFK